MYTIEQTLSKKQKSRIILLGWIWIWNYWLACAKGTQAVALI
jgi:hypothetical protein